VRIQTRHLRGSWLRAGCWTACAAALWLEPGAAVHADCAGVAQDTALKSVDGADLYRRICAGCHMPEGGGARGAGYFPALARDPALSSRRYTAEVVLLGRRNMPAFGAKHAIASFFEPVTLSTEQIAAVVNYVRTHFGNHYADTITAAEIEALDAPRKPE
jgi:mono/diheme cytochrome c family protein